MVSNKILKAVDAVFTTCDGESNKLGVDAVREMFSDWTERQWAAWLVFNAGSASC